MEPDPVLYTNKAIDNPTYQDVEHINGSIEYSDLHFDPRGTDSGEYATLAKEREAGMSEYSLAGSDVDLLGEPPHYSTLMRSV